MEGYVSNFEEFKKQVKQYVKKHFNSYASIDCGSRTITCINKENNDVIFVIVNDKNSVSLNYKKLWDNNIDTKEDITNKTFIVALPILKKIIKYATTPFKKENSKIYILDDEAKFCPFCAEAVTKSFCLMVSHQNKLSFNRNVVCPGCKTFFVRKHRLEWDKRRYPNYTYVNTHFNEMREEIEAESADFLVRTSTMKCRCNGHSIKDIVATVNVIKNGVVKETQVPGYYCKDCKKYFILESDYLKLRSKGIILCKIIEQKLLKSQFTSYSHLLNSESILHSYGYNVNAQENLSSSERHIILEFLLKNKILSKSDIKSHLNYLINRSSNNRKLYDAIAKWKSDIVFIDEYDISSDSVLKINSLKIKIYINK